MQLLKLLQQSRSIIATIAASIVTASLWSEQHPGAVLPPPRVEGGCTPTDYKYCDYSVPILCAWRSRLARCLERVSMLSFDMECIIYILIHLLPLQLLLVRFISAVLMGRCASPHKKARKASERVPLEKANSKDSVLLASVQPCQQA
jgi:hypothetical protein